MAEISTIEDSLRQLFRRLDADANINPIFKTHARAFFELAIMLARRSVKSRGDSI
jgi:hypothetical protein